jgi:hypothetical protein
MGLSIHGDLAVVHGFEEAGLGPRGSAVDFVSQDDIGEERAGLKDEILALVPEDRDAQDIGGQEIGRELDSPKGTLDGPGDGAGQHGLPDAGDILDEHMAPREEPDQGELNGFGFAPNHPFYALP